MRSNPNPLDIIRIESPCSADWDAMRGDDRRRFCQGCQKHVHNLSAMPRAEAERLVCESAESFCVRYTRSAEGITQTLEYNAAPTHTRGWRFWSLIGCGGALMAAAINAILFGRGPIPTRATVIMGEMPRGMFPVTVSPPTATQTGGCGTYGNVDPDQLTTDADESPNAS